MAEFNIAEPCASEVERYWTQGRRHLAGYIEQEEILQEVFLRYPLNTNIKEVYHKVVLLNAFYSTHIFKPFLVAQHIVHEKSLDNALERKDLSIISTLAEVPALKRKCYSFATKYCSFHKAEYFPIYDSFVEKMLLAFSKKYPKRTFANLKAVEFKNYERFVEILEAFKLAYNLEAFSYKKLDNYLWLLGKEIEEKKKSQKV